MSYPSLIAPCSGWISTVNLLSLEEHHAVPAAPSARTCTDPVRPHTCTLPLSHCSRATLRTPNPLRHQVYASLPLDRKDLLHLAEGQAVLLDLEKPGCDTSQVGTGTRSAAYRSFTLHFPHAHTARAGTPFPPSACSARTLTHTLTTTDPAPTDHLAARLAAAVRPRHAGARPARARQPGGRRPYAHGVRQVGPGRWRDEGPVGPCQHQGGRGW